MIQRQLAAKLQLHQSQVSRYARRGMPTDNVARAKAWIAANVRTIMRTGNRRPEPPQDDYTAERALDGLELLGIAADALLRAGQSIDALVPLLRHALRAVPHEDRERIRFTGTVDDFHAMLGCVPPGDGDGDVGFPVSVWHELIRPALEIARQEQKEVGPTPPMNDDELTQMCALWYDVAAGVFDVRAQP